MAKGIRIILLAGVLLLSLAAPAFAKAEDEEQTLRGVLEPAFGAEAADSYIGALKEEIDAGDYDKEELGTVAENLAASAGLPLTPEQKADAAAFAEKWRGTTLMDLFHMFINSYTGIMTRLGEFINGGGLDSWLDRLTGAVDSTGAQGVYE